VSKSHTRWAKPPATESVALLWESVLGVKILQALPATAVTFHETLRATGAMRFRTSAFPLAWALPANHALFGSLQATERCVACTSGDAMSATAVTPANAVV
jgi:hypothetical protein